MIRAALYARYSSDQQRAASIEDQLRLVREYAARQGLIVASEFTDAARSGATLLRPGLQGLLRAALAGDVGVVVAESLDRFSRDQEDTAGLFKRLVFAGALRALSTADAPLIINSPYLPEQPRESDPSGYRLPAATVRRLRVLIAEAERYLRGDRAQGSLFAAVGDGGSSPADGVRGAAGPLAGPSADGGEGAHP